MTRGIPRLTVIGLSLFVLCSTGWAQQQTGTPRFSVKMSILGRPKLDVVGTTGLIKSKYTMALNPLRVTSWKSRHRSAEPGPAPLSRQHADTPLEVAYLHRPTFLSHLSTTAMILRSDGGRIEVTHKGKRAEVRSFPRGKQSHVETFEGRDALLQAVTKANTLLGPVSSQ